MLAAMSSEPEQQIGVGTPDGFQRLWTPHRMAYIKGEGKPTVRILRVSKFPPQ